MIRVAYDGRIHGALPNLVVGLVLHPTVYVHPSLRPSQKNSNDRSVDIHKTSYAPDGAS